MKTVVMRTGVGIAIPLPGRLAETLGLRPGTTVRVEGPDEDGSIRIRPVPAEEDAPRPSAPAPPASPPPDPTPPSAEEVAQALTKTGSIPKDPPDVEGITQEIERLVANHGESLRELGP